jgi:3-hydroxyacyl-CoA dehydrogenase/enoyl-CoA hydratase/3-hydroxybutyryl-CoA epimerase
LILTGKLLTAVAAARLGIIDKVIPADYPVQDLAAAGEEFLKDRIKTFRDGAAVRNRHKQPRSTFWLERLPFFRSMIFQKAREKTLRSTRGHYPAPLKALEAVERGMSVSLQEGLEIEARMLAELATTDVCKNLISVFFLNEALKKDSGAHGSGSKKVDVRQVGLLGAGVMGGGIAQLLAWNDIGVRMKDISQEALDLGMRRARDIFQKSLNKKKITDHEAARKMSLISPTLDYAGFGNADFVIEAIVEDIRLKQKVFEEVEQEISVETIIASNTSSLSVTGIASVLKQRDRAVGFHFFNPVHRMPLVEIVRGEETSDETTVTAVAFAKRLGKIPVVVRNSPGFLVNRILGPYINEAARMLEEGVPIIVIDNAMLEFGMPMGPLHLMDEVGIDVAAKVGQILFAAFGKRMQPSPVIRTMHESGRLGKKGGAGFYLYDDSGKKVDPAVYTTISDLVTGNTEQRREDIQDRLYFTMLQEAARCLEEKVVRQARDVDAGMIFGTGFPPFQGGVLRRADQLGIQDCVARMQQLSEKYGERFRPPAQLVAMASENKCFYNDRRS